MKCLRCSLALFLLLSCASDYKHLQVTGPDEDCVRKIVPLHITTSWYNASVDVMGNHLSGLLLIKNMPDSSMRVVFTNEGGVTFFDFGFSREADFKVHHIVKQLDKKAVVEILRKDFTLILCLPSGNRQYERLISGDEIYFRVKQKNESAYFITNKDCASLQRMEWGTARKKMVTVKTPGSGYPSPETIELAHLTFNMQIKLTRIQRE